VTLEEFVALPEDDSARYEQQEGVLVLAPRSRPLHQDAMFRLGVQIHRFPPPELTMLLDVDVVVEAREPATVRAPEVVVTTARATRSSSPRPTCPSSSRSSPPVRAGWTPT
jgi:Uma2 family endonuclease